MLEFGIPARMPVPPLARNAFQPCTYEHVDFTLDFQAARRYYLKSVYVDALDPDDNAIMSKENNTAPTASLTPEARQATYPKPRNPLKRLYNWVLHWADTPYGVPALFILSFAESSFFPIPPDVLLLALALGAPRKSFKFALVCSVGGICGAVLGYAIGYGFWNALGQPILSALAVSPGEIEKVKTAIHANQFIGVWLSGFSPIPYKVFTILSGAYGAELSRDSGLPMFSTAFWTMMAASVCGRPLRFFFVGALVYKFGKPIGAFIHKNINWITLVFGLGIVAGFVAIKYLHFLG